MLLSQKVPFGAILVAKKYHLDQPYKRAMLIVQHNDRKLYQLFSQLFIFAPDGLDSVLTLSILGEG